MPVYVDEMITDVVAMADDLPLSDAQIEKVVALVVRRMEQHERLRRRMRQATSLVDRASSDETEG